MQVANWKDVKRYAAIIAGAVLAMIVWHTF